jgi:hypothetical protein
VDEPSRYHDEECTLWNAELLIFPCQIFNLPFNQHFPYFLRGSPLTRLFQSRRKRSESSSQPQWNMSRQVSFVIYTLSRTCRSLIQISLFASLISSKPFSCPFRVTCILFSGFFIVIETLAVFHFANAVSDFLEDVYDHDPNPHQYRLITWFQDRFHRIMSPFTYISTGGYIIDRTLNSDYQCTHWDQPSADPLRCKSWISTAAITITV